MVKYTADTLHFPVSKEDFSWFFSQIDNLRSLLPPEIEQWESNGQQCSFYLRNIGKLSMEKGFVNPDSEYEFIATADSKVDFTLFFRFWPDPAGGFSGHFEIQVDVNPLIELMIKRPVTHLVNLMTSSLQSQMVQKRPYHHEQSNFQK